MIWFIAGVFVGMVWQMIYQVTLKKDFIHWYINEASNGEQ